MKLNLKLEVSSEELYQVLLDSLASEIKQFTNSDITPYQGYQYKKKLNTYTNSLRDVDVHVVKLIENEEYEIVVLTKIDETRLNIKIVEANNFIDVLYTEDYVSDDKKVKYNFKLISFFTSYFNKRKVKKRFKKIEEFIITKRG